MPEYRFKLAPDTVAYADGKSDKLVVEFAIPGRHGYHRCKDPGRQHPPDMPARDIEYVAAWR